MEDIEIWKDVVGYEGLYQISNFGRVKSLPRKRKLKNNCFYISKEKIRILQIDKHGYYVVQLKNNGIHIMKVKNMDLIRVTFVTVVKVTEKQQRDLFGITTLDELERLIESWRR